MGENAARQRLTLFFDLAKSISTLRGVSVWVIRHLWFCGKTGCYHRIDGRQNQH
jgi:hypothetical protein